MKQVTFYSNPSQLYNFSFTMSTRTRTNKKSDEFKTVNIEMWNGWEWIFRLFLLFFSIDLFLVQCDVEIIFSAAALFLYIFSPGKKELISIFYFTFFSFFLSTGNASVDWCSVVVVTDGWRYEDGTWMKSFKCLI